MLSSATQLEIFAGQLEIQLSSAAQVEILAEQLEIQPLSTIWLGGLL